MRSRYLSLVLGSAALALLGLTWPAGQAADNPGHDHGGAYDPTAFTGGTWSAGRTMSPYGPATESAYVPGGSSGPYATAMQPHGSLYSQSSSAPAGQPKATREVRLYDNYFSPSYLVVSSGTEVRWKNHGKHHHTVTFNQSDSGQLAPGKGTSATFTTPGTYYYYCQNHPQWMTGTIIVY
jgi:plastocyanin